MLVIYFRKYHFSQRVGWKKEKKTTKKKKKKERKKTFQKKEIKIDLRACVVHAYNKMWPDAVFFIPSCISQLPSFCGLERQRNYLPEMNLPLSVSVSFFIRLADVPV